MVGETILHYKILEKLGEGGMGIVYLAEDTKLERKVAIKFLPHHISANSEERERFKIEAKAAASLSHPNIATIHAIEEFEDNYFIVMEYINGKELKEIISPLSQRGDKGGLPINEIINYATQIAEGLEAAHKKGIVHRDIKSQNIMITNDGKVKIMDFGLAKIKGGSELTKIGTTVGTTAYMSPEQARGEKVDQRTDIWSFGVVLYEMLTGKLPFKGDYDQAIIYSILNEEPVYASKDISKTNTTIEKVISTALRKEPENRYQTITDAVDDLKGIRQERLTLSISMVSKTLLEIFKKKSFQIGAAVSFILLVVWLFSESSLPKINPNRHISPLQIPVANFDYPSISPDGKMLAIPGADVNGNWDIYLMDIKSGDSRKLGVETHSSRIKGPISGVMFSPSGSRVCFGNSNPKTGIEGIYNVSILSGYVRTVADTGVPLCWNKSDNRIYYFRGKPRVPSISGWREYWSISPSGTNAKLEFIDSLLQGAVNMFTISISPDGKEAAFTRPFKGDFNEIILRNRKTGNERRLTYDKKTINDISWLNNGYILFDSDRSGNFNIWVIPQNGGTPEQITDETFNDVAMSYSSAADRLTYQQDSMTGTLWIVNKDGSGNKKILTGLNIWSAAYSPDSSKIAIITKDEFSPNTALTLRDLKSDRQVTLLPADTYKVQPLFSPSGRYISYLEFAEGPAVSIGKIKVLDLLKGNQPSDFGYGRFTRWLSDSIIVIQRITAKRYVDFKHLGGRGKIPPSYAYNQSTRSARLLNVITGKSQKFFRDSIDVAIPVLNNSNIIYVKPNSSDFYIVTKKELEKNPNADGKFLFNADKLGWLDATFSNRWIYYLTKDGIWKYDLKTFHTSKIISVSGYGIHLSRLGYDNNFISYVIIQMKTNMVKVDSLFIK